VNPGFESILAGNQINLQAKGAASATSSRAGEDIVLIDLDDSGNWAGTLNSDVGVAKMTPLLG
jgi:hypothetical protein